ncbi:transmembrane 7 superfamily member 3-like [Agrilus planipennis]|uniref:Transmembrane 7 superfamily member 3-like n=1 Tax=Agrilus planipennis TaxID=224129 RepID=A0A7F5RKZ9_AGRPL|nr:transmembrane 7 superfamily member 3-like [Agrilus planipennis]
MLHIVLCVLSLFSVINGQVVFDAANCSEANLSNFTNYQYVNVTNAEVVIIVKNIPSASTFFVIQAHSFLNDIILSNNSVPELHFYNEGTNVGLVQVTLGKSNFTFYLLNANKNTTANVLIAVTLYAEKDPIPGGCNLVFDVENAPYQLINYNKNMVEVSVQAPSVFGRTCEENIFSLEIYRIYLPEKEISSESYFNGIEKMITVESIRKHGWRMHNKTNGHNKLRVLYSAYPGIGSVYAMIAVYKTGEAAYVPAVTYACDAKNRMMDDCVQPATPFWKMICGISIAWGLLMCLFGFMFPFLVSYIFTGFIIGALIMYIRKKVIDELLKKTVKNVILNKFLDLRLFHYYYYYSCFTLHIIIFLNRSRASEASKPTTEPVYCIKIIDKVYVTATSMLSHVIIWMAVWYKCRSLRSVIELLLNGMLIASFFFQVFIGDFFIFESNLNYWVVFWAIVVVVAILQGLCCLLQVKTTNSVLGAFTTILAIDYFAGSYVRYIVINTIRRLTVDDFNLAIISPPAQFRDILMYFSCLVLLVCSAIFNMCVGMGSAGLSDTTPLLD